MAAASPATPQVILDALLGSGVHGEALQAEAGAKEALKAAMERRLSQEYGGE
jgi:NAD(P)H-hydrate repair Nnr-like enzyme with NAD(P)H-hydrate epimerase domain